jgi:hypothetical protein
VLLCAGGGAGYGGVAGGVSVHRAGDGEMKSNGVLVCHVDGGGLPHAPGSALQARRLANE